MSRGSLRFASLDAMPAALGAQAEQAMGDMKCKSSGSVGPSNEARPSKYRNQVTMVDGIRFDSKR